MRPFIATVIRYGCYPLIRGATAVVLFGELATGRPSFPTELLTVIVALAVPPCWGRAALSTPR